MTPLLVHGHPISAGLHAREESCLSYPNSSGASVDIKEASEYCRGRVKDSGKLFGSLGTKAIHPGQKGSWASREKRSSRQLGKQKCS